MTEFSKLRREWVNAIAVFLFLCVLVWLPQFSSLWLYRWTGFIVGVVFLLITFPTLASTREQRLLWERCEIPKRFPIIGTLVFAAASITDLKAFFLTTTTTDSASASDQAFFGFVFLAAATQFAAPWFLKAQDKASDAGRVRG